MILDCPACHSKFLVADGLIPAIGRTVRCGKCSHQWFVEPEKYQPVDKLMENLNAVFSEVVVDPKAVEPAFNLPAIKRPQLKVKPFKIAAPAIAAVWLILAFITYFPSWSNAPVLSGIYHSFGVLPTDGLVFSDVHMEREQEGSKTKFILAGSIRNEASSTRMVPTVRVSLRDKAGKAIWGREYPVNTELKAGEVYPFRINNAETSFANSVAGIVVDLGNSLQLLVR